MCLCIIVAMEHSPYEYHILSNARLKDVQSLFQEIFSKRVSMEYLQAKYNTSWTGVQNICFLAYHSGKPVAFYGATPQIFIHQGKQFLVAQAGDSMTLPAHQRKGLHKKLALLSYARMQTLGIRFVYAFHSENTYHSCKKLNWKEGPRMRGFWVKTGTLPWGKVARRLPGLKAWHKRRSARLLKVHTLNNGAEKWSTIPKQVEKMQVDYRSAFFAYKTFTPNAICEFSGARFWIKCESVISVGAVQFERLEQLVSGIEELKRLGKKLGLPQILFQTTRGSVINEWLESHYTGFDSWLVGYFAFEEGIPFTDWQISFGDLDTF